jgi:hypothetical protein
MNPDIREQRRRARHELAILAALALALVANLVAFCGDIGPATAYAAVPM